MPQFLEDKLKQEYGSDSATPYKVMNSIGAMRGNKETAKGRAMQRKHDSIPKRMAAGGVVGIPNWQSLDEPDPEISPLERAALLAKQQQEQQQVQQEQQQAQQPGLAPTPQPPQLPPAPQSAPDPSSQPQADPALDQTDDSVTNDSPGASSTMAPSIIPPAKPAPAPAPVDNKQEIASTAADLGPPMPSSIPGHQDGQPSAIPPRSIPSPVGSIGSGEAQQAQRQAAQYYRNDSFKPGTNTPIGIPIWKQALSAAIPRIAPMLMHNPNKLDQNLGAITTLAKSEEQQQQALSGEEQKRAQTEAYREWHMLTAEQRANLKVPKPGMREMLAEAMAAKGRDGQPLYSDDDLRMIAAGGKPTTDKPAKFATAPPGSTIFDTGTGNTSSTVPDKDKADKALQRDDQAIALNKKKAMGQPLTPDETAYLKAYDKFVADTKVNPGVMRMEMMGQMRDYPVINKQTGQMEMRSAADINANKGLYAPAGTGATAMGKEAVFQDLHYNIDTARKAIQGLDSLDITTRAALADQLKSTDPHNSVSTFLRGVVGSQLNPQQQEAVQALALLAENAMTLRGVSGMGQGSEELRSAILNTIPSGKSASKGYALNQLNKFEEVVKRLETGVPGVMKPTGPVGNAAQPTPTYKPGDSRVINGVTYTRDNSGVWR